MSKEFNLRVGGINLATVRHRRVLIGGKSNPKKYGNMFYGDGWKTVVERKHLEPGKPMVFTNLGGNSVSVITFAMDGLALGLENIPRTPMNEKFPICRGPLDKGTYTNL